MMYRILIFKILGSYRLSINSLTFSSKLYFKFVLFNKTHNSAFIPGSIEKPNYYATLPC